MEEAQVLQVLIDAQQRELADLREENGRLREALKSIRCSDCKDGVLFADSLLFDLDREDEQQPCQNCAIRNAALNAALAHGGEERS